MNKFFSEIKKNFGFGCMRLPMKDDEVDYDEFTKMVDTFIENGFNYFDTAHGYLGGKSEIAIKKCLTSRYPRDAYILTDKLSSHTFKTQEDIRPIFEKQLAICGVDYFDFYLMHAQAANNYDQYKNAKAYETAFELKKEGKIKHVGFSFHDKAEFLDKILTEYPQVEVVQLQFNYKDYEDASVESRKCYEVCLKHNKPVIVMEPVRGGSLVNLPAVAKKVFDDLHGGSPVSYAIRFAASFPNVMMVLSGMGDMNMMTENVGFMKNFVPLNDTEKEAVEKVCAILNSENLISCTACRYCIEHCPKSIAIPDLFACLNAKRQFQSWNTDYYYDIHTQTSGKASDCIKCGRCEDICPQHLEIRKLMEDVSKEFDK